VREVIKRLAQLRVPLGFLCGLAAYWYAEPTWRSLLVGTLVAMAGEGVRFWAAGHLERWTEITKSGPYRLTGHPLYVGSSIMGVGLAVAANQGLVAAIVVAYLAITLSAAVRTEKAELQATFGSEYRAYREGGVVDRTRRFSLARAIRNREWRVVLGLLVAALLLALKAR
jgi:protein-S-isoprenylcysteine O-methyltransferase Ste14